MMVSDVCRVHWVIRSQATLVTLVLGTLLGLVSCSEDSSREAGSAGETRLKVTLETHTGGFFEVSKPEGWQVITAGNCSSFALLLRDPDDALRQVFYFGEVGPLYLSAEQKQIDGQYMRMGGYPIAYHEMPVVAPLTPTNFLAHFAEIARTSIARNFMPQCPHLDRIEVIASTPQSCPFGGGQTALIRALFTEGQRLGEGLFLVTVVPFSPMTGGPGAGIGWAMQFIGVSAPHGEFAAWQPYLVSCVESFTIDATYVQGCLQQQAATYAGILKAGQTLRETSDLIMTGWEQRNRSDDVLAVKRSDAMLGYERLYDPESGEVYEFDLGFYDAYDRNRERYEMGNLQPLPADDQALWTRVARDGRQEIR